MKTYEIPCQGEVHEIGIAEDGDFVLLNHDVDEERVLAEMGYEPPECIALMMQIDEGGEDDALISAAEDGHLDVVGLLLEHGAHVHAVDDLALRFAATKGHRDVVRLLLEHGADIHAGDDLALRWAARYGHSGVVKLLLEHGADVHTVDDEALRWAAEKGHSDVVKYLKDWIEEHG